MRSKAHEGQELPIATSNRGLLKTSTPPQDAGFGVKHMAVQFLALPQNHGVTLAQL